jgi:hypothetical protein
MKRQPFAWSLVLLLVTACAAPGPDAGRPVLVRLRGVGNNAGEIGQAALVPVAGGTQINITISGVPPMTTRPVHIFTFIHEGSCSNLPERATYELNDRTLVHSSTGRPPFTLANSVPVPMEQLLSGRYALALRNSPASGNWLIFCGELVRG